MDINCKIVPLKKKHNLELDLVNSTCNMIKLLFYKSMIV